MSGYLPDGVKFKADDDQKTRIIPGPPVGNIVFDIRATALRAAATFNANRVAVVHDVIKDAKIFETYLRGENEAKPESTESD